LESLTGSSELRRPPSEPIRAAGQVEGALARMGIPGVATNLLIRRDWRKLVSGPWRDKARPLRLEDGCLVLEVASPMDATLLRYGGAGLAEQLNAALGAQVVLRIRPQVAPSWRER